METIFYYLETGEIISKQELSSILNGFSVARGKIGIVNKNQAVKINEGKIENVPSIENISSIIPISIWSSKHAIRELFSI